MQSPQAGAELSRLKDMERRRQEVLAGVIGAIQAMRQGEQHERIKSTVDRHAERLQRHHAEQTAQRPPLPQIVVTPRQDDAKWDYSDRRYGFLGAARQE
ncbi:MAG: hypothetical protein E6Z60_16615 [Mixta calida]|uniref:hypothetical protein n=1 Tax=Mixta calida TaxID=665913 RepID=UPI00289BC283|nr:hypothetical protein [Mixta calida]MDU5828524.1 hypothetical protein [Mixta calida]